MAGGQDGRHRVRLCRAVAVLPFNSLDGRPYLSGGVDVWAPGAAGAALDFSAGRFWAPAAVLSRPGGEPGRAVRPVEVRALLRRCICRRALLAALGGRGRMDLPGGGSLLATGAVGGRFSPRPLRCPWVSIAAMLCPAAGVLEVGYLPGGLARPLVGRALFWPCSGDRLEEAAGADLSPKE
ncbi:hypothetical protein NDU88_004067 [Pleurodeles waltl]|uniref:Uncharacterized protein n=1 Tax=Pleurodeles waltl TaxID=8319 RepID=A0AAV7MFJ1_PLEWA|nr:hypothetical protein NDU88_004067 [Pleurodeles waltl]